MADSDIAPHGRHATWLELFYDLIYVVSVAFVAKQLAHDVSVKGVLIFGALFVPIWFSWAGHTIFSTRFDKETRFQRTLTLLQMLAAAALAVQLASDHFEDHLLQFGIAYTLTRLCLVLLYLDASRASDEARQISLRFVPTQVIAMTLWAVGAFLDPPVTYVVWGIALAIDFAAPVVFSQLLKRFSVHVEHMPERFGLFTIIVLGETILATVTGVHELGTNMVSMIAATLGFGIAVAFFVNYFNYVERAPLQCSLGNGQRYIFPHLPLVLGLTASGVAVEHAIVEARHAHLEINIVWLLCGGVAAWMLSFGLIQIRTYPSNQRRRILLSYGGAVVALGAIALAGPSMPPLATLSAVLVVVGVIAVVDVRGRSAVPSKAYVTGHHGRKDYLGRDFVVTFDASICTHSGVCLRELPHVFDTSCRPWVQTDRASRDEIKAAVALCPTGSLQFYDGSEPPETSRQPVEAEGLVKPMENGPLILHGDFKILDPEGTELKSGERVVLCRCGESANKPFCDGSHRRTGFKTEASD